MDNIIASALKKSFFITLIYVGLGTLCLFSSLVNTPDNEFIIGLAATIALITLPVTFIGWGILYSSPDYGTALLVQSIIFLLFWLILFLILKRKLKRKIQIETPPNSTAI